MRRSSPRSTTRSPRWAVSPSRVLGQSIDALEGRDPDLAAATIQQDEAIDELETEIEEQAIVMIARRQPLAYDLRQIMAALRISTDLERIGDLGKNIAKRRAGRGRRAAAEAAHARPEAYGRACSRPAERGARRLYRA